VYSGLPLRISHGVCTGPKPGANSSENFAAPYDSALPQYSNPPAGWS
jgi:hypothetical protein